MNQAVFIDELEDTRTPQDYLRIVRFMAGVLAEADD